tara:strand:+ start:247 stop:480 length:234 start_codon:yes stop_codon:yes gene_type:complete
MNKEFERYLIIILLLVLIGLSGCVQKTISTTAPDTVIEPKEEKPSTITDSVGKMEGIANALGCMFAPQTCKAKDTNK